MKKHYYTDEIVKICDNHHFTVDAIFEQIQRKFPEAGKSSIYRNVEKLAKKGLLRKVTGIGKKAFFEKTKENHAHFICKNSGKILDIPLKNVFDISNFSKKQVPENSVINSVDSVDIKIYGTLGEE